MEEQDADRPAARTRMMLPERPSSTDADVTACVVPGSEPAMPVLDGELYRPAVLRPLDELREQVRRGEPGALGGRYALDEVLGQGGMGEVWLARDLRVQRTVALKRLRAPQDEGRRERSDLEHLRFMREAQLTGALEHPNIVPVYDLGVDEAGALFFTMKRLRGRSLAELLEAEEMGSLLSRLDVFRKVCDAIAFAHAHSVIHRDLKPDNVMVGEFGEVMVLDWGLGKRIGEAPGLDELPTNGGDGAASATGSSARDSALTQAGAVIGTPAYMAPEQAAGKLDELDARADVYALGALLYTLLTGKRPFAGKDAKEIMIAVRRGEFEPPSAKLPLPPELDAIVCTAMALEPRDRYPSVERLRADVQAFLEKRPVSVLRYSALRRLRKWAGRNRRLVSAVGLTSAIALLCLVAGGVLYVRDVRTEQGRAIEAREAAEQAREAAELAKGWAELAEREAAVRAADAQVGLARSLAQQDELLEALDKLDAASVGYAEAGADPIRATLVRAYIRGRNPAPVYRAALPQGARVEAMGSEGRRFAWRVGARVVVDDWVAGERTFDRELDDLAPASLVRRALVATKEGFVVAREREGSLELAALDSGERLGAVDLAEAERVELGSEARTALVHGQGWVQAWDTRTQQVLGPRLSCGLVIRTSLDARRVLCQQRDMPSHILPEHFSIWDTSSGEPVLDVPGAPSVALSPDGRYAVISREHDGLRLYEIDSGSLVWHLDEEQLGGKLMFSADSRRIFSSGGGERTNWLNIEGEVLGRRHERGRLLEVDASGQLALVVTKEQVQIWATGPGAHAPMLPESGSVRDFELASDELLALGVNAEEGVIVHDPLSGARLATLDLGAPAGAARFDAQGRVAASTRLASRGGEPVEMSVQLFELARSSEAVSRLNLGQGRIVDIAFVLDDEEVLIGLTSGEMIRWNPAEDRVSGRFDLGQCPWQLVASPDGEQVYIAGRSNEGPEVEVWDVAAGERLFASTETTAAYGVALDPRGGRFSTVNAEGQPRTWSLSSSEPLLSYPANHREAELGLAYSADGEMLYSIGYEGKSRFWDTQSQSQLLLLPYGLAHPVFSAEGGTLLGYGSRFELELGSREATLELSATASSSERAQRFERLIDTLSLQQDWANAVRALDWAEAEGFEPPALLAGRIAWAHGDPERALAYFRSAPEGAEQPSLEIWIRMAEQALGE